jgi:hypothetical protein
VVSSTAVPRFVSPAPASSATAASRDMLSSSDTRTTAAGLESVAT